MKYVYRIKMVITECENMGSMDFVSIFFFLQNIRIFEMMLSVQIRPIFQTKISFRIMAHPNREWHGTISTQAV